MLINAQMARAQCIESSFRRKHVERTECVGTKKRAMTVGNGIYITSLRCTLVAMMRCNTASTISDLFVIVNEHALVGNLDGILQYALEYVEDCGGMQDVAGHESGKKPQQQSRLEAIASSQRCLQLSLGSLQQLLDEVLLLRVEQSCRSGEAGKRILPVCAGQKSPHSFATMTSTLPMSAA